MKFPKILKASNLQQNVYFRKYNFKKDFRVGNKSNGVLLKPQ